MGDFIESHDDLAERLRVMRALGKRVVFTNGCFDILHVGHIRSLRDAKSRGDILVIGVNSDRSVRKIKGPSRPVVPEEERVELLCAFDMVDYVTVFDDETADAVLEKLRPDIHAKGTDYTPENVPERETVLGYGGEVAIVGDPKDHSTKSIVDRIQEGEGVPIRAPERPEPKPAAETRVPPMTVDQLKPMSATRAARVRAAREATRKRNEKGHSQD